MNLTKSFPIPSHFSTIWEKRILKDTVNRKNALNNHFPCPLWLLTVICLTFTLSSADILNVDQNTSQEKCLSPKLINDT